MRIVILNIILDLFMHSCYAVRSSSEAALYDVGVVADDPPVMSFPPNKKEAETRENPWVSTSKKHLLNSASEYSGNNDESLKLDRSHLRS